MDLKGRSFLTLLDFNKEEIRYMLDLAHELKAKKTVSYTHLDVYKRQDMGLIPGTKVKVLKMAPMGDPIQIHLRGYDITIRKEDGEKIVLKEGSVQ